VASLEAWRFAVEEGASASASIDEAARQAPTKAGWQCAPGCDACCHLMVQVTPREVDALLPHVTPETAERVRANAEAARGLDAGAYRRMRVRCAFLDPDGRCEAYDVRPIRCRSHVSADVEICRRVFAGELNGGAVPGDTWLQSVASAVQQGLGGEPQELHTAVRARIGPATPELR